jgi:hypothetical protein
MLLPFYVDQDRGWLDPWKGFSDLKTFEKWQDGVWQDGVVEYHANIRGADFYEARARHDRAISEEKKVEEEKAKLQKTFDELRVDLQSGVFSRNFEQYRDDVDELLAWGEGLRKKEETYKEEVSTLRNEIESLNVQIAITKLALEEAKADLDFSVEQAVDKGTHVPCPICGAEYANTWAERFSIAVDRENLGDALADMRTKATRAKKLLAKALADADKTTTEREKIEQLLARRDGEVRLEDLLRDEGRRELRAAMRARVALFDTAISDAVVRAAEEKRKMDATENHERRTRVNETFRSIMESLSAAVAFALDEGFRTVRSTLRTGGSDTPRGLLAYKVAFLHLIREFGKVRQFPLLVDSPDYQDQDDPGLTKMLVMLRDRRPTDTQLILGATKTLGVEFGGTVLSFDHERHLLRPDKYEPISAEFGAFDF